MRCRPASWARRHTPTLPFSLARPHLLEGLGERQGREDAGPLEASLPLAVDVRHPTVPAAAEGGFRVGPISNLGDPQGVVEDLHVHAERVHVVEAELHVVQLARGHGRDDVVAGPFRHLLELLLREGSQLGAAHLAVDDPELLLRAVGRLVEGGAIALLIVAKVVPSAGRLDDVGVGVDGPQADFGGHGETPFAKRRARR